MRKLRNTLLAGAGALLVAGGAVAAEKSAHVMNLAFPDGSVAQVRYVGEVAPRLVMIEAPVQRIVLADPFAQMARISAMMELQHRAMMQRVAQMEAQMADAMSRAQSEMRMVSVPGEDATPAGVVQYSYVSTTSANGCTTTVQWRSDGSGAQPQVHKTSAGSCAANPDAARPVLTAAPKAEAPQAVPGAKRT